MSNVEKARARKSPEWLKRAVVYQIFLRAFTPEGTLKAAEKKLPELAELGVDVLYLCPICLQDDDPRREFWSNRQKCFDNPRNPYRIKDFYAVDPEYGTSSDLRDFVKSAHKLGLRVLLDIVYSHCGPSAVFIESDPDFVKRKPDGSIVYTSYHFPVVNFESAGLREHLLRNLEFFVRDFDVDGYRCDVADDVPLDFWNAARPRLEALKPDVLMIAEGHKTESFLSAFDLVYNFPWTFGIHSVFNRGKTADELRALAERQRAEAPEDALYLRYIDNHDIANDTAQGVMPGVGWASEWTEEQWKGFASFLGVPDSGLPPDSRIDKAWGSAAVETTLALSFAVDGVPMLYNGQEIADVALHSIYLNVPVAWAEGETARGAARRAFVKRLCALRHSERALEEGSLEWLDNASPKQLLSFVRQAGKERIIAAFNLGKSSASTGLSGSFEPLLISKSATLGELEPYGFFIGKEKHV